MSNKEIGVCSCCGDPRPCPCELLEYEAFMKEKAGKSKKTDSKIKKEGA